MTDEGTPIQKMRYEKISKLAEMGKRIDQSMKNSIQHLNDFLSLGLKTEDPFEFKRAVAEVSRIIKLATDYQKIITRAHEIAEGDDDQGFEAQMAPQQQLPVTRQAKPSPVSAGMQEKKLREYAVVVHTALHNFSQMLFEEITALHVNPGIQSQGDRFLNISNIFVSVKKIFNPVAVRDHTAVKSPVAT